MKKQSSVTAFAPATVANVAVGFDILGFSLDQVGDEVTVSILDQKEKIEITEISGVVTKLPKNSAKNTASVALHAMIKSLKLTHGFSVQIKKGIAMGSGMGGSAASAVGAVVAANELLMRKFSRPTLTQSQLLEYALVGESAASGAIHGDNVGPCLKGGLTLLLPTDPMQMVSIPAPKNVFCVLVHPELKVETRAARGILKPTVKLAQSVKQSAYLGGWIAGCFQNDLELIQKSMNDVLIEPQRSKLIPGFQEMKKEALKLGALGFSISGSGPSVFAWVEGRALSEKIAQSLSKSFLKRGIASQFWVSSLAALGARVKD